MVIRIVYCLAVFAVLSVVAVMALIGWLRSDDKRCKEFIDTFGKGPRF